MIVSAANFAITLTMANARLFLHKRMKLFVTRKKSCEVRMLTDACCKLARELYRICQGCIIILKVLKTLSFKIRCRVTSNK